MKVIFNDDEIVEKDLVELEDLIEEEDSRELHSVYQQVYDKIVEEQWDDKDDVIIVSYDFDMGLLSIELEEE